MEIKSTTKYARFSPKKGRDVAREIVGLSVSDAIDTLTYTPKKAAFLINKTLKTAVADAENNFDLDAESLIVKSAAVTTGTISKRFKPRARGSAAAIRKRTCHITVTVEEGEIPEKDKRAPQTKKKKAAPASTTTNSAPAAAPVEFKSDETAAPSAGESRVDETLGLVYTSAPSDADDLKLISGVGPVLETKLNEAGLYTYEQIIAWNPEQIEAFDNLLSFKGRIERDNWIEQAKTLHAEKGA